MISISQYTKSLLLLLFLLTATNSVFSQPTFFPIHPTVQVLPPHGLYLSDYYSGTRDRLIITLHNRDFGEWLLLE